MNQRPNLIVITSHDTGRHLNCYGIDEVNSPCIDALARDGVRMSNYFATVPICCASRATMMTGRYPQSHGLMDLHFPPFEWAMHDNERHLTHMLHDAGYHTRLFGMQHEVGDIGRLAFDVVPEGSRQTCDEVARDVAQFIADRKPQNQAWFAQVGFFETHSPFTWGGAEPDMSKGVYVPPYVVPSEPTERMAREFQGSVRKMDAAVGTIIDALKQHGQYENTLLIVTTDHGIEFPRAKWTLYDPGLEIFLVAHWPAGNIHGGRVCDALQSNVDFLPTLVQLLGLPIEDRVQGRSFAPVLTGEKNASGRDEIFAMYAKGCQGRAVRTNRYKLIRNFSIDRWYRKPVDITNPADYWVSPHLELYDLENDPLEFANLADDPAYGQVQARLQAKLRDWLQEVNDPILQGPLRTPFYERSRRELG